MVNAPPLRLIPYERPPAPLTATNRKLSGPRYRLEAAKAWAVPSKIWLVTDDCSRDLAQRLDWTTTELAELLLALTPAHYRGSEWCGTGNGSMLIDCDAYAVKFDIKALELSSSGTDLYVKFGFRAQSQNYILIISCHPSTSR
jgi:hypothetical protein